MWLRCVVAANDVSFFVPSSKIVFRRTNALKKKLKQQNKKKNEIMVTKNKTKTAQKEYVNTII